MSAAMLTAVRSVLLKLLAFTVPSVATVEGFISKDQFLKTIAAYLTGGTAVGGLVGFLAYMADHANAYTTSGVAAMAVSSLIGIIVALLKKFGQGGEPSNPPAPSPKPSPVKPASEAKMLAEVLNAPVAAKSFGTYCPPGQCHFGKPLRDCPDQAGFTGVLIDPKPVYA